MTDKATPTLAGRIAAIMGSIGGVEKKGKISSQGSGPSYKFAADPDVLKVVIPKLAADGIVMIPEHMDLLSIQPNMRDTQMIATVKAHWLVTDGVEELRFESLGMGQDSGDKSLPKAQTNARKYGLFMLLHIVTGDDPDQWSSDADEHRTPVQRQPPDPRHRLAAVASEHKVTAARLEQLAAAVGVPKGEHATAAQIEQIIGLILIETPQESVPEASGGQQLQGSLVDPAAAPPAAPEQPASGNGPQSPEVPVAADSEAGPSLQEVLAAAGPGAEVLPPRPGEDAYKALDPRDKAAARAYWQKHEPAGARETHEPVEVSAGL